MLRMLCKQKKLSFHLKARALRVVKMSNKKYTRWQRITMVSWDTIVTQLNLPPLPVSKHISFPNSYFKRRTKAYVFYFKPSIKGWCSIWISCCFRQISFACIMQSFRQIIFYDAYVVPKHHLSTFLNTCGFHYFVFPNRMPVKLVTKTSFSITVINTSQISQREKKSRIVKY